MPLIQGGPPEWIWERTPEALKWQVVTSDRPDGQTLYELRVQCPAPEGGDCQPDDRAFPQRPGGGVLHRPALATSW